MHDQVLKIGVSARFFHPEPSSIGVQSKTLQYLEQSMAHWLMSRDVLVFMIPSVDRDGAVHRSNIRLADYAKSLDGLVLQGGADLAPETYGEAPLQPQWAGDRVRDLYEIEVLNEFIAVDKPVLGVCRGAQLINVALGGTLHQDINSQLPDSFLHRARDSYDDNFHTIAIKAESGLARLYPQTRSAKVNSIHHQSIKQLGRDLVVEAQSASDGVIEAIRWQAGLCVWRAMASRISASAGFDRARPGTDAR
ncbi:MAG: Glutamine amidotransferase class-I:Peptidase [Betaproteobacteria bacterium]|nr:Glutamine amidotransferase class-I:Peptidase [Betaproteobacteria bacterium]